MRPTFDTSKEYKNATNTAMEALDSSSEEITLNDIEAKEIPEAMLLIDGY